VLPSSDDGPSGGGGATGAPAVVGSDGGSDAGGTDEVALPDAEWLFSDGRALIAPPEPGEADTRPLWAAILLGLAAGIGLTITASVVVNNLHRDHPA
jgi:hypothetical protein